MIFDPENGFCFHCGAIANVDCATKCAYAPDALSEIVDEIEDARPSATILQFKPRSRPEPPAPEAA